MVKGDAVMNSSVALSQRAVAGMALRQGGIPQPKHLPVDSNTLWGDGGPCVLG